MGEAMSRECVFAGAEWDRGEPAQLGFEADDLVADYYPEMMDVPAGTGPKEGRFAREKDRGITFRQLISNTSGYLKPGEEPGQVFHYQTYGMCILCHAIATRYGYYDSAEPGRLGGFGNTTQLLLGARDMARLGLLWLRGGGWAGRPVVPEAWMREATRVAPLPTRRAGSTATASGATSGAGSGRRCRRTVSRPRARGRSSSGSARAWTWLWSRRRACTRGLRRKTTACSVASWTRAAGRATERERRTC